MTDEPTRVRRRSRGGQLELWVPAVTTDWPIQPTASRPTRTRQLARCNPAMLQWGRESLGLSLKEAAAQLRIPASRLEAWERGNSRPTIPQLRKIAHRYRRSLPAFFLPAPPRDWPVPRDWRRLPGHPPLQPSPELLIALRLAFYRRSIAMELDSEAPSSPVVGIFRARLVAEDMAVKARALLGVTLAQQESWEPRYGALNSWKNALERAGVLVFHFTDVPVGEVRGFSLSERTLPVIGVNGSDSVNGRIFTLAHELGHLMLGEGGSCDLGDATRARLARDRTEVLCNQFAGALLVPADALIGDPVVARADRSSQWSDFELDRLATRFRVSREVVLRRLLVVGRASIDLYRRKRAELLALPIADKRGQKADAKGRGPGVAVMVVRDVGKPFARLVLDAYHADSISGPDVADYLGVGLRHLPAIETRLVGQDVLTGGNR